MPFLKFSYTSSHQSSRARQPVQLTAPGIVKLILPPLQLTQLLPHRPDQRLASLLWFIRVELPPHRSAQTESIDILCFMDSHGRGVIRDEKAFAPVKGGFVSPCDRGEQCLLADHN